MSWSKINTMFPYGGVMSDQGFLSLNDIIKLNLNKIESLWTSKATNMIIQKENLVYYSNGNMDRYDVYNIYPPQMSANLSSLNPYGQKILNDSIQKKGTL